MKPPISTNPQTLAELMLMAVDFAGFSLRSERQIPPTLLAVTKKGPLFFTPAALQDDRSKNNFANTAGRFKGRREVIGTTVEPR